MPRSRDACPKLTPRSLINPIASSLNSRVYFRRPIAASPVPCSHLNSVSTKPAAAQIRQIAEDIDSHRKRVLKEQPKLTLTGLYNVLEELRRGTAPDALDP